MRNAFLFLFVFAGFSCSGPLITNYSASSSLALRIESLPFPAQPAGSRFLLPEMAGKTVSVTVTRMDQAKEIHTLGILLQSQPDGRLTASQNVKVPINVRLKVVAEFRLPNGEAISRAESEIVATQGTQEAREARMVMMPTAQFPGLQSLSGGSVISTPLDIVADESRILTLELEEGREGEPLKVYWTIQDGADNLSVWLRDAQGKSLALEVLEGGSGILFTPETPGKYYIILHANGKEKQLADIWYPVMLAYHGNGHTAGDPPASLDNLKSGDLRAVSGPGTLEKAGWKFQGWNTSPDGTGQTYLPGETITFGSTMIDLYALWKEVLPTDMAENLPFTFRLDQPGKALVFQPSEISGNWGTSLILTCSDATLASQTGGWKWYVDGVRDPAATSGIFTFAPAATGYTPGFHVVSASLTQNGVEYSGSLKVTIYPETPQGKYTVIYSNLLADGGMAPQDSLFYSKDTSVTVAGNPGGLSRTGRDFLGWTIAGDSSGTIYAPQGFGENKAAAFTITASTTLHPVWSLIPLQSVPSGTFQRDSSPSSLTTISGFLMGRYEVTRAQYQAIMDGPAVSPAEQNLPVSAINLYGMMAFCNKLSLKEGLSPVYIIKGSTDPAVWGDLSNNNDFCNAALSNLNAGGYRLPTEMEWMWAAMGAFKDEKAGDIVGGVNVGGFSKQYAGEGMSGPANPITSMYAVMDSSEPQPVGSRLPNELGLYDLSGNIAEMCIDRYLTSYPAGWLRDPLWGGTDPEHGSRGGDYTITSTGLGVGHLSGGTGASATSATIGFRVVRSIAGSRYVPRSGMVGEWLMDGEMEDSSGLAASSSPGNRGPAASRKSQPHRAMNFYTESEITAPKAIFGPQETFTLSFWLRPDAFPSAGQHGVIRQNGTAAGDFQYWLQLDAATQKLIIGIAGHSNPVQLGSISHTLPLNQWTHVAFSWRPDSLSTGTLKVWINGVETYVQAGIDISSPLLKKTGDTAFQIGGGYSDPPAPDYNYAGGFDDLRIYNRNLSREEVQLLYQE